MSDEFDDIDDDIYIEPDDDLLDDDIKPETEVKSKPKSKKNEDDEDEEEDDEEEEDNDDYNIEIVNEADEADDNKNYEYCVAPDERITSQYMFNYEFVKLIGVRATQISQGSRVFCKVDNLTDPLKIAEKELYDNKCPLSIKRYIRPNQYEIWSAQELIKRRFI
jgi:DNA-directed RNA polymerase subunit K/omega